MATNARESTVNNTAINDPAEFHNLIPVERVELLSWIKMNLKPSKSFNLVHSSYEIKHIFEDSKAGFYVTNGEFRGAMRQSGYDSCFFKSNINTHFNVSRRSVKTAIAENEKTNRSFIGIQNL